MAGTRSYDQLRVSVFDTVTALAAAAAEDLAAILRQAITEHGAAAAIFATGNSQLAFYQALQAHHDIAWDRVTVFHMDEYLGLPAQHPASFCHVIQEQLVSRVGPRAFHGIVGDAPDIEAEMERYAELLTAHQPVACVMGIWREWASGLQRPASRFQHHADDPHGDIDRIMPAATGR